MSNPDTPNNPSDRSWIWTCLLIFSFVPTVVLCALVHRYWVSVPAWDDWEMAPLIVKAHAGTLRFSDLFEQQQESRTVFPKLVFILLAAQRWDVRDEIALSVLACVLTAGALFGLLRKSGLSRPAIAVCFPLMTLLIFSPAQHELWLLASGFPSFVPALVVVSAVLCVRTKTSTLRKFVICAVLAFLSSFTLAHGLLAWGLTFPLLFLVENIRPWRRWLMAWSIACGVCAGAYFWQYKAQSDLPPFAPAVPVLNYLRYLLIFLGSSIARPEIRGSIAWATAVGGLLLSLFFVVLCVAIKRRNDREFLADTVPWFAIGFYAIGSAALATLGRVAWGVAQAQESRYVSFSLYLAIAVIGLIAVIGKDLADQAGKSHGGFAALSFALAIAYLSLLGVNSVASVRILAERSARLRLGHAALLLTRVVDGSSIIKNTLYPRPQFAQRNAVELDRLGLLKPRLVSTREISANEPRTPKTSAVLGWCDGIKSLPGDRCSASGWAAINNRQTADSVVLAYALEERVQHIFAISESITSRLDVARRLGNSGLVLSGWQVAFSRGAIPAHAHLSAWAVDAATARFYQLPGNYELPSF